MKVAIVQFPGSNCERETIMAVKRAGMDPVEFLWNENPAVLTEMDGFVIVGGFSYEDRSRAGIIAALDPVMQEIKNQADLGKPVLGICNGAQILVETGMVPGVENNKVVMALAENKRISKGKMLGTGYYNAWVHLKLAENYQRNAFTLALKANDVLHVPLAHGEGRFIISDALLKEMKEHGLALFQYCDVNGRVDEHFPVNPNASVDNIAAVSNKAGNVMAMMPHPERCKDGDVIFQSMKIYIEKYKALGWQKQNVQPLYYYQRQFKIMSYNKYAANYELLTELIITDNAALTVQQALQNIGLNVKVKRYSYWGIQTQLKVQFDKILKCEVLFNPRKEKDVSNKLHEITERTSKAKCCLLVKPKDDVIGSNILQLLVDHFDIHAVEAINSATLWVFESEELSEKDLLNRIVESHIIFNTSSHDCYDYIHTEEPSYSAVAG